MCYSKVDMQPEIINEAHEIDPDLLADYLKRQKLQWSSNGHRPSPAAKVNLENFDKCLIVDCRSFIDYNNWYGE